MVKKSHLVEAMLWSVVCLVAYIVSMYLLERYVGGDQVHYTSYYEEIGRVSLPRAYELQGLMLGSREPLFALVMWLGAILGFDKDVYVSILNVAMIAGMILALRRWRVPVPVVLLLLTNYYLFVLMTGAERLKLSYLLMFFGVAMASRWRWVFLAAAPLAHFQTIINYLGAAAAVLAKLRISFRVRKSRFIWGMILSPFVLAGAAVFVVYLGSAVSDKGTTYLDGARGIADLTQGIGITGLGFLIARRKGRFLAIMLPMLAMVVLLGGIRVNMIVFVMFFYAVMTDGRAGHPLIYLPLLYLSYKTLDFVSNIMQFGQGFG